jgi:hypothetical protein
MPASGEQLPFAKAYHSIQEAIDALATLEREFVSRRDRRAVFVSPYVQVTQELQRRIEADFFHDSAWVTRYLLIFANLYRKALAAHETHDVMALPKAWQIALNTSASGAALVIQDLLLGMNAHINRDLPFALFEVGLDPQRDLRYRDHIAVNAILHALTDQIQDRIAAMYASGLGVLDSLLGNLDESFISFDMQVAREHAWNMGVALTNARSDAERQLLAGAIENQAAVVARLILTPNVPAPWLIEALRAVEQIKPWWECLRK